MLHFAARSGSIETCEYLLSLGCDACASDWDYWRVIHSACRSGNIDVVKLIIKNGGDIKLATKHGLTTMHIAALSGSLELCQFLAENGIDKYTPDSRGRLPKASAINKEVFDFLKVEAPAAREENPPDKQAEEKKGCRIA